MEETPKKEHPLPDLKITRWNAVAGWQAFGGDKCAICKNLLEEKCTECRASEGDEDVRCTVSWGQCNHAYHTHCIDRWVAQSRTCPLCQRDWSLEKVEGGDVRI
eukprot:TRINITY_DN2818_c0_g1_i1.p2 TRINITY_DN2818_c0_g1~~TRINITY_DN2818_c0_g1_i1.p2  ORF type:complete len:104 (-),score=15.27 TRINITY_DN2818_c0_g1_i1:60-371(-)